MRVKRRAIAAMAITVMAAMIAGCAAPPTFSVDPDRVNVVVTTPILADLARNVAGDRADVISLVPNGGDPHSYEPTLRDVRNIVYADLALSNYMLLEEHNLIKTLDANIGPGVPNISLAESAVKYAAEVIPLVEDVSLDTIWLGLRVRGGGEEFGATRISDVFLSATGYDGPGHVSGYLTETFGQPRVYFDSSDGFQAADGYRLDTATLPTNAHTHMSWAFTHPGIYRLDFQARLQVASGERPIGMGETTVTFAVGVDPYSVPGMEGAHVLNAGHADLAVDLDTREIYIYADPHDEEGVHEHEYDPRHTVIEVPNKGLLQVPADPAFSFLGRPGDQVYQLPQGVLGKHVHGEIDPHLWHDVRNAQAYVEIIRDELIAVDPEGANEYRRNAAAYLAELDALDLEVQETIASIPQSRRYLITTHDAFAYLGKAYDVTIAGFVTPNPATEPSLAERRRLSETIRNLQVPAVFLEPNLIQRSSVLAQVAREENIRVCSIYSDSLDDDIPTYVDLMRYNANSLKECLS